MTTRAECSVCSGDLACFELGDDVWVEVCVARDAGVRLRIGIDSSLTLASYALSELAAARLLWRREL